MIGHYAHKNCVVMLVSNSIQDLDKTDVAIFLNLSYGQMDRQKDGLTNIYIAYFI